MRQSKVMAIAMFTIPLSFNLQHQILQSFWNLFILQIIKMMSIIEKMQLFDLTYPIYYQQLRYRIDIMPSYSLGRQKKYGNSLAIEASFVNKNQNPGVGAYNTQRRYFDSTLYKSPSYGIGKAKKFKTEKSGDIPAPNSYKIENKLQFENKGKGFHIVGKRKERISSEGPGPAGYNLLRNSQGKFYTFGMKTFLKDKNGEYPGPGNYSPRTQQNSMNFCINKAQRNTCSNDKLKIPGPGSYEHSTSNEKKQDKYSFTKQEKFSTQKRQRKSKQYPGQFNYTTNINFVKKQAIAIKFGKSKRESAEVNPNPGPCHYRNIQEVKSRSPNALFGNSTRQSPKSKGQGPGPGKYLISENTMVKKEPAFGFPRSRRTSSEKRQMPGPGSYDLQARQSKIAFKIAGRNSTERKEKSPGPQDYNPQYEKLLRKTEMGKIGKDKREPKRSDIQVGPGDYDIKSTGKPIMFQFPRSVKKQKQQKIPGPGAYNIRTNVGQN